MQLTIQQAARRLGKSERQVRYMLQQGKLAAEKQGGVWMIDSATLPASGGQQRSAERKQQRLRAAVDEAVLRARSVVRVTGVRGEPFYVPADEARLAVASKSRRIDARIRQINKVVPISRGDPDRHYGSGGTLTGKQYMLSLTFNAPAAAFDDSRQFLFQGKGVDELFFPMHMNFRFFGMEPLKTFACFDVLKNPRVEEDFARYRQHLQREFAF